MGPICLGDIKRTCKDWEKAEERSLIVCRTWTRI